MTRAARAAAVTDLLARTYPDAHCELDYSNPLELLIATILSAQCTDKRVNIVTPKLFKKYRTAAEFAGAQIEELEELIKTTGFFHNKAKNIKGCCQGLVEKHDGAVPQTMEELHALPGVGRKTANVVVNVLFGEETCAVDTHVFRLANRTGMAPGKASPMWWEIRWPSPPRNWARSSTG